jgi:23S rRNA (uracil1939-C5)-methyltransferase
VRGSGAHSFAALTTSRIAAMVDGGYRLKEAKSIDQFPWSGHLELVAVFER